MSAVSIVIGVGVVLIAVVIIGGVWWHRRGRETISGGQVIRRRGEPDVVGPRAKAETALMKFASAQARATLTDFTDAMKAPKPGQFGFAVKKAFDGRDDNVEHIWLIDVEWDGQVFTGRVNNRPVWVNELQEGDTVAVRPKDVTDWMYVQGDVLVGGYTTRALMHLMPPRKARRFQKRMPMYVPPLDFPEPLFESD